MSDLVVVTKVCRDCGQEKTAAEFYKDQRKADGLYTYCKPCSVARIQAREEKRREEMGDDAYRAHKARIVREYRRTPKGRRRTRLGNAVQTEATRRLKELHRSDYEHLLAVVWSEVEHGEIEL